MEEKDKKLFKIAMVNKLKKLFLFVAVIAAVLILALYTINGDTFEAGVAATNTYTGNAHLDPSTGITIQIENEDGTTSDVTVEDIFEEMSGADIYLKDDEISSKEDKLQYLLNAELVTKFPYISAIDGDESKLNGVVKFYR